MATTTNYPLPSFYFTIGWGNSSAAFAEATSPKFSNDVIDTPLRQRPGFSQNKNDGA